MKPADRYQWLLKWITRHGSADVLDRYFVDDYIEATNAKCITQPYGADKCPQLGRDLSAMCRLGMLKRHASGIWGMAGMGFPRWVWSYSLPKQKGGAE